MAKQLLSPRDLAQAIGVSESSIKRWADDGRIRVARTAGRHRRIPFAEAIRFVRETESVLINPSALGLPSTAGTVPLAADALSSTEEIYDLLVRGDDEASRGFLMSLYLGGHSVAAIADGPLRETFQLIGELWHEDGDQGIFVEHRATEIALRALHEIGLMISVPPDAPVAVGGAPAGDPYLLPTSTAAVVVAESGLRPVNLGGETPLPVLGEAAERLGSRLIWLSVTSPPDDRLLGRLDRVLERAVEIQAHVVVGGRSASQLGVEERPNLHLATTMSGLAEHIQRFV